MSGLKKPSEYFNEWRVHWRRRAELTPKAVALADAICAGDLAAEERARRALLNAYGIWRKVTDGQEQIESDREAS